jgi:putative acetyltransferase
MRTGGASRLHRQTIGPELSAFPAARGALSPLIATLDPRSSAALDGTPLGRAAPAVVLSAAMNDPFHLRDEVAADAPAIAGVVTEAFGQAAEAELIAALRAAGALSISLVAVTDDGGLVGHVAFSPVTVEDAGGDRLFGLAPLAVAGGWQGRGVGGALVEAGLARACALGGDLAVVLGEPAYYRRFGFRPATAWGIAWEHEAPPEAFMALELRPGAGVGWRGRLRYHPAFDRFPA